MRIVQDETIPAYRWAVISSLTASVSMAIAVMFLLGLLLPDISAEMGLSPSQQGWLGSSVMFGNLFFSIPANLWLSKFSAWRVATVAFFGVALFTMVQGMAPFFTILLIGRIGVGVSFIATQAPRALIIQQWTSFQRLPFTHGVVFGCIDLIMGAVFFITPIITIWLDDWRRTLYVISGVIAILAVIWMLVGRERITGDYSARLESQNDSPLLTIVKYKQLWVMGLGMASAMLSQSAFHVFWPTFAGNNLGISVAVAGISLGLMQMVAAPSDFITNAVPALVRRQPIVLAVCGLGTVVSYLGLLYTDSVAAILLFSAMRGFFFAFFPILMLMVYQLPGIKPREVAVGVSFMQTSIWVGAVIGPLLVGFVQEATGDLRMPLTVAALSPLILVIAAGLLNMEVFNSNKKQNVARVLYETLV